MNSKLTRALPALAIAAVIATSASTGAVAAAAFITGADIVNGTVTTADLKNNNVLGKDVKDGALTAADLSATTVGALKGATGPAGPAGAKGAAGPAGATGPAGAKGSLGSPGISGYQLLEAFKFVNGGTVANVEQLCPVGTKVISGSGHWRTSSTAVQFVLSADSTGGTAYTSGIPTADNLHVRVVCGVVQ